MTYDIEALKKLSSDIQGTINAAAEKGLKPIYQHSSGRRLYLDEVLTEGVEDGPIVGALNIVYSQDAFMSIDRIERAKGKFKKKRRIILYLDSKPGQIGSALLLELLKLEDGEKFSKHRFVQKVDKDYFQANSINISSGEVNEALSRMFRKTMNNFFGVEGRNFVRKPFLLKMQELGVNSGNNINYQAYKNQIDSESQDMIYRLNRDPRTAL